MKVFVVNPFAREITEAEHDGTLESLYRLTRCDTINMIRIDPMRDVMYIDDNGLLRPFLDQQFFKLDTYSQPLAGYGVVVGIDAEGNDTEPNLTIDSLRNRIEWLTQEEAAREL